MVLCKQAYLKFQRYSRSLQCKITHFTTCRFALYLSLTDFFKIFKCVILSFYSMYWLGGNTIWYIVLFVDRTEIVNDKQYTCNCYSINFIDRVYFNKSHMSTNITSLYLPSDFRNNSRSSKEILVVNRPSRGWKFIEVSWSKLLAITIWTLAVDRWTKENGVTKLTFIIVFSSAWLANEKLR